MTPQSATQTTPAEQHLLIVEDDLNLGFLLLDYLQEEGYHAKLCRDGESGLTQFGKRNYDLCILDVMMPRMDGFELAQAMKAQNPEARFLFLTAKSLKADKCRGYELGAEDYMTKPFDQDVLLYKIKAILRRNHVLTESVDLPEQYQLGGYQFYHLRQELVYGDKPIRLTEKENAVLRLLCANMNEILRRDEAVEQIYGKRDYFLGRSFDVFISRLRKHLAKDPRVRIENVYKVGFILSVD